MKKETARQRFKKWLATKQWVISAEFENALADFFAEENTESETADAVGYTRGVKITKDQMRAEMPCGHPAACIEGAPDFAGDKHATTQYCAWCADIATKKEESKTWRDWAQFVFLGGGVPKGTDRELQRAVSQASDKSIIDAHKSGAEIMREKAALHFQDSLSLPFSPVELFKIQREIRALPLPKKKP